MQIRDLVPARFPVPVAALLVGCLLLAACSKKPDTSRPPAVLRFGWQPGKTYRQTSAAEASARATIMGKDIKLNGKIAMGLRQRRTRDPAPEQQRMAYRFDRIAIHGSATSKSENWEQTFYYDSDAPVSTQMPPGVVGIIKGMLGKTLSATYDERAQVINVDGYGAFGDQPALNSKGQQFFRAFFSEGMAQSLAASALIDGLPREPVVAGQTWDIKRRDDLGGGNTLHTKGTYTMVGHTDYEGHDCALLERDSTLAITGPINAQLKLALAAFSAKGFEIELVGGKFRPKMRDRIHWDNTLGLYRSVATRITFDLFVTPRGSHSVTVPIVIDSSTTLSVEGENDA